MQLVGHLYIHTFARKNENNLYVRFAVFIFVEMKILVIWNIMLCTLAALFVSLLFLEELLNVDCSPHYFDEIKDHEMGRTCSMHGGDEKYMHRSFSGNLKMLILVTVAVGMKLLDCWDHGLESPRWNGRWSLSCVKCHVGSGL